MRVQGVPSKGSQRRVELQRFRGLGLKCKGLRGYDDTRRAYLRRVYDDIMRLEGLVRSHEERRWLFEVPNQSRISPSIM